MNYGSKFGNQYKFNRIVFHTKLKTFKIHLDIILSESLKSLSEIKPIMLV